MIGLKLRRLLVGSAILATLALAGSSLLRAQTASAPKLTSPKDEWGHIVADDYFEINYQQLMIYWHKLEKESNRIHVQEIGRTAENRPHLMAIITSPANYAKIDRYKEISRRLSLAEGLTDAQARDLAKEGKTVVWIDGGLHATETVGAQQLVETVYQLVSGTDEETQRFLNDVIVLCTPANPDGMDLVSDWYMKHGSLNPPRLWNHYAGHDDNRDSFMNALPETTNVSRVMYREWFPQIMYNHHQAGPAGSIMFAPPFRDPFNYNFHPEIPADIDLIGAVMAARFIEEGKPGVVNRKGQPYSTWWNGGFRTTAYFHNQIGILTETVGGPDPTTIPFTPRFAVPEASWWWPIKPQEWHFRQSIDYSVTANKAVIDFASRFRENLLYRIYQMGRDEIQWGNEDHWTFTPHKATRICVDLHKDNPAACAQISGGASALPNNGRAAAGGARGAGAGGGGGRGGGGGGDMALYGALTTKDLRDPRGYIMPSDQPDFGNAIDFVNALIKSGVAVMKATQPFTVGGKSYPANSLVIKTAQAFRPHVIDMFEPQDYPDDFDTNGNPVAPYDDAGWTLAYQMGVKFDRILDGFAGPFEKIADFAKVPAGIIKTAQAPVGYYFSHENTYSFVAINRLVAAGEDVSWLASGPLGIGTFYVAAKPTTMAILQKAATDLGVSFQATTAAPTGAMSKLRKLRIGLVDSAGGSMPVGWTRLVFKNFEFPYVDGAIDGSPNDIYGPDINAGNLHARFDVLVFNNVGLSGGGGGRGGGGGANAGGDSGAPPPDTTAAAGAAQAGARGAAGGRGGAGGGGRGGRGGAGEAAPGDTRPRPFLPMPDVYAKRQGAIDEKGVAALQQFVEDGGTIIAIGNQADSAVSMFKLPLTKHSTGARNEFYAPSSVFQIAVDPKAPLAHGYGDTVDIFYSNNVVWDAAPPAAGVQAAHAVGWFASDAPLRSGWAWGQKVLNHGIEIASADVGKGHVFLFGNELTNRSQPHGNFKFFFNALYLSVATEMK